MKPRILVTGGAGYLGSILVPELLNAGYRVTVLDNFLYSETTLAGLCANPHFDVVRGDARLEATLKPLLKTVDFVIPLAALVGAPLCDRDPMTSTSTNKGAILTLVKLAGESQGILLPTTNSGYGTGDAKTICTEESPLHPISLYARDKMDAEVAVLSRKNSLSFRLATVFGMSPRMRIDLLVNDFTYRALRDRAVVLFEAHFKRNYIHIHDVARAFMHALDGFDRMRGGCYNVGLSDANLSKIELCERIKRQLPDFTFVEAGQGKDADRRNYIVSNEKIERTGFRPRHGIDDGIRELIKGYAMLTNSRYSNV